MQDVTCRAPRRAPSCICHTHALSHPHTTFLWGDQMSDLVAVAFDDETTAFELRSELAKLQKEYLIAMEDVVIVTRDDNGKVKLHQAVNMTAAGAAGGGFWGMLIGLIFLNPLLGAAVGAGAGALSGYLADIGIDDDFIKGLGENLPEGGSAIFVLVKKVTGDKVLERLEPFRGKGRVLKTSLAKDSEDALREALEAMTGGKVSATDTVAEE